MERDEGGEIGRGCKLEAVAGGRKQGYVGFRTQIKQGVETAKRPTAGKTF